MAQLAMDIPPFIIEILNRVDYSKITASQYDAWLKIIKIEIGKHLKLKTKAFAVKYYHFPIRQDFCDEINRYDFKSMDFKKQLVVIPLATKWAENNLPLIRK